MTKVATLVSNTVAKNLAPHGLQGLPVFAFLIIMMMTMMMTIMMMMIITIAILNEVYHMITQAPSVNH